jgi:S-adenosylmethionine:tRNA ribosyltransferase-isomerase
VARPVAQLVTDLVARPVTATRTHGVRCQRRPSARPSQVDVPDYDLPAGAIAQRPAEPRDSARLLVALDPGRRPEHRIVRDLPELVDAGDVIVVNTSRVMPARLRLFKATGGAAEVLLLEPDAPADNDQADDDQVGPVARNWKALVRPGRRLPPGTRLATTPSAPPAVEVGARVEPFDTGQRRVKFLTDPAALLAAAGAVALPPYINEPLVDPERYQTVYADRPGSVAAPTAGLHLTTAILDRCRARGAEVHAVDLAVGLATFRPISTAKVEEHVMHAERFRVPPETLAACHQARRVIAIGTTTLRALESAAVTGVLAGDTSLYIHGDYSFEVVDVLMTNFHLPRSSLLVLLEAFCGPRWRDLYADARAAGYRFLSFGDAMIVSR